MFKMARLLLQDGQTFKMANLQVCQGVDTLKNVVTDFGTARTAICVIRSTRTGSRPRPQHDPPTSRPRLPRRGASRALSLPKPERPQPKSLSEISRCGTRRISRIP